MAKDRTVDRKELYRMICALSDADVQKAVSYVSFLRFVDVSQGKDIAELLRKELSTESGGASAAPASPVEELRPREAVVPLPVEPLRAKEPAVETPKPKIEFLKPETDFSAPEAFKEFKEMEMPKKEIPKVEISEPEVSKPEVSAAPESPAVYDVGDFYAPVRSPRLEQAAKPEEPTPVESERVIPRLMRELEESVHSIFDSDREHPTTPHSRREREEPSHSLFEPLDYVHDRAPETSASEAQPQPVAETPARREEEPVSATSGLQGAADDFYMPVRSERFEQLRKPTEPESIFSEAPVLPYREEPEELSMFHADPEPLPLPVKPEEPEKPAPAVEAEAVAEPEAPSEAEQKAALMREKLQRLMMSLRLTYDGVAHLFDAPVSVVYSWFDGAPSDAGQEAKLDYFLEVADRVGKGDIPRPDLVFHRPFASGETFLDKLKRQKVTGQDLKVLKETADRAEELRRKPKGSAKPFYPFEETIALYSIPLYGEAE